MRHQYDLPANFTEADIRHAEGLSAAAEIRTQYGLRPDFSAQEYQRVWENRQQRCPLGADDYAYNCK